MANKIVTLKDSTGTDNCYPITPVDAVFVDSNTTLSNVLDDKADIDMSNIDTGSITADKIDLTTFGLYTDYKSNFSIPTSSDSRLSVTIATPGKYLLLFNLSSQSQSSSYSIYSDFYIDGTAHNVDYVTVMSGGWGHLSNMYVADITTANTQVNLRLRSTTLIAASYNNNGTLIAIRVG